MPCQPSLCLITPALADARNGNWQTAQRWAKMFGKRFSVRLMKAWDGQPADLMIALHARRSAQSIAAWAAAFPDKPLIVTLTGTDLYRDIQHDGDAQHSLELATRLIVLQELGPLALPAHLRGKCAICFQSVFSRRPQTAGCSGAAKHKTSRYLRALAVGHLREEKSPDTFIDLARRLQASPAFRFDHIGGVLEPAIAARAHALAASNPHYRWLGALTHEQVRRRISRAHLLIHPSRIEGGAHVIMEAVASGTPVLASHIDGNVGMLGTDYAGYFKHGDVDQLAALLQRCRNEPAFMTELAAQGARRAPLFEPRYEQETLLRITGELLAQGNASAPTQRLATDQAQF